MIKKKSGFTLVEVMVVIAIIGILAALALPAYSKHIQKTHRVAVESQMMEMAGIAENHFSQKANYNDIYTTLGTGGIFQTSGDLVFPKGASGSNIKYTLSVEAVAPDTSGQSFAITALAVNGQASDRCPTLTLDNFLIKTPVGCWE